MSAFLKNLFGGKDQGKTKKRRPRVLVVDDEPAILKLLTFHLDQHECQAVTAGGFEEAFQAIEKDPKFRLFILDINMPGKNGLALAKKIRKTPGISKIPILIISGHVSPSKLEALKKEIPRSEVIAKPFERAALIEMVDRALEGKF